MNRTVLAFVLSLALLAVPLAAGASVSVSVDDATVAPGESVTITPETENANGLKIENIPASWSVATEGGADSQVSSSDGTKSAKWLAPDGDTSLTLTIPADATTETVSLTATAIEDSENTSTQQFDVTIAAATPTPTATESQGGLGGDGFEIDSTDTPSASPPTDETGATTTDETDGAAPTDEESTTGTSETPASDTGEAITTDRRRSPTVETGPGFGIVAAVLGVALGLRRR